MSKTVDKEARLRRKLVNNELNPIADAILSIVLLCVTPLIWTFAQIHDKLMFKFLNKTYIYNVSWEVSETLITFVMACILSSFGSYPSLSVSVLPHDNWFCVHPNILHCCCC
jgi:hypothetical protein